MNKIRSLLFVALLYGSMVILGIIWLPSLLMPRSAAMSGIRAWVRVGRWGMKYICGASSEVRGLESMPQEPILLAPRHQSTFDTMLPFLFLKDPCFILKKELLYYPVFGLYAKKTGMIAIDRDGSTKTLKAMAAQAKAAIDEGRSLVIFPEGTRIAPGAAEALKPGIALVYKDIGVPCVPVALNTGYCWPAKGVDRYPGHMVMELLPAIEPGLPRKQFMATLEERLEAGMGPLLIEGQQARSGDTEFASEQG